MEARRFAGPALAALLFAASADAAPEAFVSITTSGGINASTYNAGTFRVVNNSTGGFEIQSLTIDLRDSILPDMVFDPAGTAGDKAAKCFEADSGAATVGLVPPANPCTSPFSLPHDDGYYVITLDFTDFDQGETFTFSVDADPTSIRGTSGSGGGSSGSVSGVELTGALVTVAFSGGSNATGEIFRTPGSLSGGQNVIKSGAPSAPGIQAVGLSSPTSTSDPTQTIRVTGSSGAAIRLLQVEAALDLNGGSGFDLDPFEANTAVAVTEKTATIGASGSVDIDVTLTDSGTDAGYNYFRAVRVDADGSGRTGATSNLVVLRLAACTSNSECADGNPCTNDVCSSGSCSHVANSASCDDGVFCNGADTCSGGSCSLHAGDPCADGPQCADACDEASDSCDEPAGTPCGGDGNPCTDDECNGAGACVHVANDAPCDDGVFCNGTDTCSGGSCTGHAGDPCEGGGVCDEQGSSCVECLVDEDCDDGLFCNGVESCDQAICASPGNPCSGGPACRDGCDEDADDCRSPDGSSCDDGDACTTGDSCNAGICVAGQAVLCDDGATCNGIESCDPLAGCLAGEPFDCSAFDDECAAGTCQESPFGCIGTPTNEGGACSGLDACTVNPRCEAGDCVGDPLCDPECELCDGNGTSCLPRCGHAMSMPGEPIRASDALLTLRAATGESACLVCVCDVDASGSVAATDALILLSAAVGADVLLECPPASPPGTTTTTLLP